MPDRERSSTRFPGDGPGAVAATPWLCFAAALIVVSLCGAGGARAQVSPGPLAAPHAELDALTKCFACHSRSETMAQRCLDCHTEIAWSRSQRRGLHARGDYAEC
ncbi:MAG TPA: hypothetical protein VI198_03980, partial [Candidatus Eisenbacteria bacterium]